MEQNRIQINGVWYVREDQAQENPIELDPVKFEGVVVENKEFCFEATRILKDDYIPYDNINIKFTDKRVKPWKEDNWDSDSWMKGVLNNNPNSLKELPDIGEGTKFLKAFLQYLKDEKWL